MAVRQSDGSAILDSPDGSEVILNDTAMALWELCDGSTEVEEMVRAVDAFFDVEEDVIRHDVEVTLAELTRVGALDWDDD